MKEEIRKAMNIPLFVPGHQMGHIIIMVCVRWIIMMIFLNVQISIWNNNMELKNKETG